MVSLEPDNSAASDAILAKLNKVSRMAEGLDSALRDVGVLCESDGLSSLQNVDEDEEAAKSQSEESTARCSSDQESAVTAPLWNPTSRSSSYHTASECRSSPWWDSEKASSDLEAEIGVPMGMVRIRPTGTSSASTSFDESDHSSMSTSLRSLDSSKLRSKTPSPEEDPDADAEEDEETTSSTISQESRKQSLMPDEEEILAKMSLESPPPPGIIEMCPQTTTPTKVSGDDDTPQPDFMAWNRYYQSLINKQTLRSCL